MFWASRKRSPPGKGKLGGRTSRLAVVRSSSAGAYSLSTPRNKLSRSILVVCSVNSCVSSRVRQSAAKKDHMSQSRGLCSTKCLYYQPACAAIAYHGPLSLCADPAAERGRGNAPQAAEVRKRQRHRRAIHLSPHCIGAMICQQGAKDRAGYVDFRHTRAAPAIQVLQLQGRHVENIEAKSAALCIQCQII